MKVRYGNYRKNGEEMTGKIVDMDDAQARILIESNIVTPVEDEIETATIKPRENTMQKLVKKRR